MFTSSVWMLFSLHHAVNYKKAFEWQNVENKNVSVKCFLPAFYINCGAGPGCFIRTICEYSVCCFLSRISYLNLILVRFFFRDAVALLRESYTFQYRRSYVSSINFIKLISKSSSMNRLIPPFSVHHMFIL